MKHAKKRAVRILLAIFALISAFGAAMTVNAAVPSISAKSVTCSECGYATLSLKGVKTSDLKNKKIAYDVKYTKKSIAEVYIYAGETKNSNCIVSVHARKKGKTKATITIKYGKKLSKKVKLKLNITVNKYQNPCASLKIGKKNLTSLLKSNPDGYAGKYSKKEKLSVKAKSGWRIAKIEGFYKDTKLKKLQNNAKFDVPKYGDIVITFENKKTKEKVDSYIYLNNSYL